MRNGTTTLLSLVAAFAAVAGLANLDTVEVPSPWDEWDLPLSDFVEIETRGGGLPVPPIAERVAALVGESPDYLDVRAVPPVSAAAAPPRAAEPRAAVAELALDYRPGAGIEGRLETSADGHFVPNESARRFFESYYLRFAPQSDELIRGRMVLQILDSLPPRAADEAIDVLDRWRAARNAAGSLDADATPAQLRGARDEALGAELAAALYSGS